MCVYGGVSAMTHVTGSILSPFHEFGDPTQVVKLGGKCLYNLSGPL